MTLAGWKRAEPGEEVDPLAKRRNQRRHGLHLIGVATLVFVSRGSYDTVVWAGGDKHWSLLYPVIVDLLVVLVMPSSTDGTLPNTDKWPIRRMARLTTGVAFGAIVAFNALWSVLASMPQDTQLPAWARPTVAVVAGIVPVVLYMMGLALNTMTSGWEAETATDRIEAEKERLAEAAKKAEAKREEDEERDRRARERAAKRSENRSESQGESQPRSQPAAANGSANGQVSTGKTLQVRAEEYIRAQIKEGRGHELTQREIAAQVGGHASSSGLVLRRLRSTGECPEEGKADVAEQAPQLLSVVGSNG